MMPALDRMRRAARAGACALRASTTTTQAGVTSIAPLSVWPASHAPACASSYATQASPSSAPSAAAGVAGTRGGAPIINSSRRSASTAARPTRSSGGGSSGNSSGAPPPKASRAALEYCARLVRQHDPDNFAWAVLLPPGQRARALALRALNVETLLVPSAVRRSAGEGAAAMLRIRYQWWRDAVRAAMEAPAAAEAGEEEEESDEEEVAGENDADVDDEEDEAAERERRRRRRLRHQRRSAAAAPAPPPPAHPVVTALWAARASAGPRLQRYPLRRLIDAREREALSAAASEPPPLRLSDLDDHAEATHAQLLYAQVAALSGGTKREAASSSAADHAASHAGRAVGLAMALRGLPYAAAQRRCVLPLEVCASAGLSQEDLFRRAAAVEAGGKEDGKGEGWSPRADAALRDAVLAVASRAVGHLREARALASAAGGGGGLSSGQAHALLPAVAAGAYLRALERTAHFDVFHPALRPLPPPPPPSGGGADKEPPPPPPGAGLGVSPLRYLLSLRWHAWRGTF